MCEEVLSIEEYNERMQARPCESGAQMGHAPDECKGFGVMTFYPTHGLRTCCENHLELSLE